MFLFLTLGAMEDSQLTTRKLTANTNRNIVFPTVKPDFRNEFQATYMLVGVGALISLFLFIIVIQHCKKSKTSKKRNVSRRTNNDAELIAESSTQGNQRGYNIIYEQPKDHLYSSCEVQYEEINESLEMSIPTIPNMSTSREDVFVVGVADESKIGVNSTDCYLMPIFVRDAPTTSRKEQEVYINVEQV